MKLRKYFYIMLSMLIIFTSLPLNNSFIYIPFNNNHVYAEGTVTIYAPDGRCATIYESEAETYFSLGWYRTFEEVTTTIYAPDGRSIRIYIQDLPSYLALGWYDSFDKITSTLYSADGRQITVYNIDVPSYLALGWHLPPTADPSKPMVALTFDDGPSPYYTKRIVDTLVKYGARATFFSVGENVQKYPDVTKYVYDNGMEIANHTYTHPELTKVSASDFKKEIANTSAEIKLATGITPKLIRPPYGSLNANIKQMSDMPLILWSIDTEDWKSKNADTVFGRVAGKVKDGDIILMHDLYKSTADATDKIVPYLIESGFQIVTVSTLAECKGYTLSPGQTYRSMK